MIAQTPDPPYYVVIFTSKLSNNTEGYDAMADRMVELVSQQEGFLGIDHAREDVGITVCYWKDLESIQKWKDNMEHARAKSMGKSTWYDLHITRIAKVEKEY